MSDFVGIDTITFLRDTTRVKTKLKRMLDLCPDEIVNAVNPFIVEIMQAYDPWQKVTRARAYGRTFETRRQQRYFFWALAQGVIRVPYQRTGDMGRTWRIVGDGQSSFIANESQGAVFTMGNETQANLHTIMGWRTVSTRLQENRRRIIHRGNAGAREAIRKAGL